MTDEQIIEAMAKAQVLALGEMEPSSALWDDVDEREHSIARHIARAALALARQHLRPEGGAAAMREACAKAIMVLIHDHDCAGQSDKIAYNCAIVDAAARIRALPIPATPPDTQSEALACGHHHSLAIKNIESQVVSCELCEAHDELRDALTMERDLDDKVHAQSEAMRLAREALADLTAQLAPWLVTADAGLPAVVKTIGECTDLHTAQRKAIAAIAALQESKP